jgi:hypothetical protein
MEEIRMAEPHVSSEYMDTNGVALRSGVFPAGEAVELERESDEPLPVLEPESLLPVLELESLLPALSPDAHSGEVHVCLELPVQGSP